MISKLLQHPCPGHEVERVSKIQQEHDKVRWERRCSDDTIESMEDCLDPPTLANAILGQKIV